MKIEKCRIIILDITKQIGEFFLGEEFSAVYKEIGKYCNLHIYDIMVHDPADNLLLMAQWFDLKRPPKVSECVSECVSA